MFKKLINDQFIKAIISNKDKECKYNKGVITLVKIKNDIKYQLALYSDKQVFHENLDGDNLNIRLNELLKDSFKQIEIFTEKEIYGFKRTSKDKILTNKRQNKDITKVVLDHNHQKKYILNEGMIIPPLIDLGVFSESGKIIASKYDKYKQINRFLEIIDNSIGEEKKLNIIDFGCGKSYLTFILYYYLVFIKTIDVKIIGLDLKEDVIKECNSIRDKYHYDNLSFELGDISLYQPKEKIDMIITLHACDTATDYALYHAIKLNTKYIFSVPCCQHEINKQLSKECFNLINKYGLFKERFSSLLTDSIRANILEAFGYKVDVIEFIDMDNSPKNVLLRCKYNGHIKIEAMKEISKVLEEYNINQKLFELLKD